LEKNYKSIYIKRSVLKNVMGGHPWCFSGAILKIDEGIKNGDLCEVYCDKTFVGIGYFNQNSDISIRLITRLKQKIDFEFFFNRFTTLRAQKEQFIQDTNAYRLVFGESDNIPGLVVDIYNDVIVVQVHTMGIENLKENIVKALIKIYNPKTIHEKSEIGVRANEGLPTDVNKVLYGKETKEVVINEHNFKFSVNIPEGQKTGFFLDQRENRLSIVPYCKNKTMLNCFCYTGGFSIYAAKVAKSVTSIDISKPAIENTKTNFKINGYDLNKHKFIAEDVFNHLKTIEKDQYDLIILDPPSFAKNKKQLKNAIKAYITINSKALEKLPDYGILISSSCTSHIDELTFIKILHQSAVNTNCQLKVLESKAQPQDHGYNLAFPEGRYLKFFILQKIPIL